MGKTLKLVSPIPPSVNHYLAYRAVIKHGKPLAMSYKTPEAVKYRKEFAEYVASKLTFGSNMRGSGQYREQICKVYIKRVVLALGGEQ